MYDLENKDNINILLYNRKGNFLYNIFLPYEGTIKLEENKGIYKIEICEYKERNNVLSNKVIKNIYMGKSRKLEELLEEKNVSISKSFAVLSKNTTNLSALYRIKENGVKEITDYIEENSLLFNNLKEINEYLNKLNQYLYDNQLNIANLKRLIRTSTK